MHDLLAQPARDFDWGPESRQWIPRRDGDRRDALAAFWPLVAVAFGAALLSVGVALAAGPSEAAEVRLLLEPKSLPEPAPVVVHVTGMVERPGIVVVAADARAADAVEAAGGELSSADLALVNLAAPVIDGMQLHLPPAQTDTASTDYLIASLEQHQNREKANELDN